jgi:hypothetical protein
MVIEIGPYSKSRNLKMLTILLKIKDIKRIVKSLLSFQLYYLLLFGNGYAQTKNEGKLLRIYEDNDFINIRGKGTDRAYSGGTRVDIFYQLKRRPWFLPGFFKFNGDSNVHIGEWGIMQTVFTPNNIAVPYFQPNDYFYSGAVFLIHSLYSYNPTRHFDVQYELQLGVRGPAAFGRQAQTIVHRLIHYQLPNGWDNQLRNSPILNVNFALEKQIASSGKLMELLVGGKACCGTLQNGVSFYNMLRLGVMNSYFDGFISQFSNESHKNPQGKRKMQAYLLIKPEMQYEFNNALLEGGVFAKKNHREI